MYNNISYIVAALVDNLSVLNLTLCELYLALYRDQWEMIHFLSTAHLYGFHSWASFQSPMWIGFMRLTSLIHEFQPNPLTVTCQLTNVTLFHGALFSNAVRQFASSGTPGTFFPLRETLEHPFLWVSSTVHSCASHWLLWSLRLAPSILAGIRLLVHTVSHLD